MCAEKSNTAKEKITLVVQRKIVKVARKVFAVNMHCIFISIVIKVQVNFVETLDLEIFQ